MWLRPFVNAVEIFVVFIIIAVLTVLFISNYGALLDKVVLIGGALHLKYLADSMNLYYIESGKWPLVMRTPPYGNDDPSALPVDSILILSKFWSWSIEGPDSASLYGNRVVARVKDPKISYEGCRGLAIEVSPYGTRRYGLNNAKTGEWEWEETRDRWPFCKDSKKPLTSNSPYAIFKTLLDNTITRGAVILTKIIDGSG